MTAASPAGVTEWSLADPARPVRIATMPGPGPAQGIAYAPDHTMVAVAYAKAVLLWNLTNPAAPHLIATIPADANVTAPGYSSVQEKIAFSPDGRTLATTTGADSAVSLWDVSTPSAPRHLATVGRDTGPLAQPLAARCRTDDFPSTGAFTFTSGGTAIVGPESRGADQPSDTLSAWPPLPG